MILYRFEDFLDTFGVRVRERHFKMIKGTPCGYWIRLFHSSDDKKWVSKTAKKRFAYPSREDAITSFKARKKRQVKILEEQLSRAKRALALSESLSTEKEKKDKFKKNYNHSAMLTGMNLCPDCGCPKHSPYKCDNIKHR